MADELADDALEETRRNAAIGWAITLVLCALAVRHVLEGSYRWFAFTALAAGIVVLPAARFRDLRVLPPWELLVLVAIPVVDATVLGQSVLTGITVYVAVAAVALVAAVEIERFTPVRMNHAFAIALVVLTTLAVAAGWNVAQWASDALLGTDYIVGDRSQDAANRAMMFDFAYAALAGVLAGAAFDRYFRGRPLERVPIVSTPSPADDDASETDDSADGGESEAAGASDDTAPDDESPVPSLVRGRLAVPESTVRRLSRAMQVALALVLGYALLARDVTGVVNASVALAITGLPSLLERDHRLPLEPELVFWLTAAVFLHALGSAGLYDLLGPWDSLTHALSASIVAAAGYAVVRAVDLHTDEVYLPPKMLFVFILVFVLAFGVLWELMEFAIDTAAQRLGLEAVLAQHGIDDTIGDLLFDLVGAVVVAVWGSVYLTDVSYRIAERFGG